MKLPELQIQKCKFESQQSDFSQCSKKEKKYWFLIPIETSPVKTISTISSTDNKQLQCL